MSKPRRDREFNQRPAKKLPVKFTPSRLRIVAGTMRGRRIEYNGDPATRPMKEKTREAVFSLLGGYLHDTVAIDLFAGTGILGFEAISRGSIRAILLEMARPAISTMLSNMRTLHLEDAVDIQNVDTLRWLRSVDINTASIAESPWIIFCCPPYAMWNNETERLLAGLRALWEASPGGSQMVCETDNTFDLAAAIPEWDWDVRNYSPAIVSLVEKPASVESSVDKVPAKTDVPPPEFDSVLETEVVENKQRDQS